MIARCFPTTCTTRIRTSKRALHCSLDLPHTAINAQINAGNEAAVVRGEKKRRSGDFFRPAQTGKRNIGSEGGSYGISPLLRLGLAVDDRSVDWIRRGDLPKDANPDALARYVYTVAQGISVQATWGANREQLLGVVEIALRQWPS
jgi:hypothetical protein